MNRVQDGQWPFSAGQPAQLLAVEGSIERVEFLGEGASLGSGGELIEELVLLQPSHRLTDPLPRCAEGLCQGGVVGGGLGVERDQYSARPTIVEQLWKRDRN